MVNTKKRREESQQYFTEDDLSDGTQETRELKAASYREALGQATADLKARWEFYRERYARWMK